MTRPWLACLYGSLFLGLSSATVQAQAPTALVLEVKGTMSPRLEAYTEILDAPTIKLAKTARLQLLHYESCHQVTLVGGTLTFGAGTYALAGGRVDQDVQVECPKRVSVAGNAASVQLRGASSIQLRGGANRWPIPGQPTFVLVGQQASTFSSLRVTNAGQTIRELPLTSRRVVWPADAAPLQAGEDYEVLLVPTANPQEPLTVKCKAVASPPAPALPPLTVLQVE